MAGKTKYNRLPCSVMKRLVRKLAIRAMSVLSSTAASPAAMPTTSDSRATNVLSGMCFSRQVSILIHHEATLFILPLVSWSIVAVLPCAITLHVR